MEREGMKEARKFLEEYCGDEKFYDVECIQRVTMCIAASSREEAKFAASKMSFDSSEFDGMDVRAGRASVNAKPDSGVFDGKVVSIDEYTAQRVWRLVREKTGGFLECPSCGYSGKLEQYNCNLPIKPPEYGYIPKLRCLMCRKSVDWMKLMVKFMEEETREAFRQDLVALLNKYSLENGSDTPDFVLADYLVGCLESFNQAYICRKNWYQRKEEKKSGDG